MRHRLGTFLLVIGIGVLAWAATVYLWKDPFTTAYTAYEQRRLESNLDQQFETWKPAPEPVVAAAATDTRSHAATTSRARPGGSASRARTATRSRGCAFRASA